MSGLGTVPGRIERWLGGGNPGSERPARIVPPAVTPLGVDDFAAGISGHLRRNGRERFREEVRGFLGGESVATYTSIRRALADCFRRLGRNESGTRILIPAFCSTDYPEAIEGVGLDVARYDVEPTTLGADLDSLRERSFEDVAAVVAVNVLGYTSWMDDLAALCTERDTPLVEALGYGLGSTYRGTPLGTYGDCSVLNFQQGKPVPVGGGMVVSQRPELEFTDTSRASVSPNAPILAGYALLSKPLAYGVYARVGQRVLDALGRESQPSTHPEAKTDIEYEPPFSTFSDFQGGVGHSVFRKLADHRRQRAATAQCYSEQFDGLQPLELLTPVEGLRNHQFVRYPVLAASTELRDRLVSELRQSGIGAGGLYDWPPIDADQYPGAATLQDRLLALPTHPYVTDRDRRRIVDTVQRVITSESQSA